MSKTKLRAAGLAAVAVLLAAAAFDETNVVSLVARKAAELIGKALGLLG